MLKRTIARLLLFGIPFTLAYYGSGPAPATSVPTFVICPFSEGLDDGRTIVVAATLSACTQREQPGRSQNEASPSVMRPAVRLSSGEGSRGITREPLHFSF